MAGSLHERQRVNRFKRLLSQTGVLGSFPQLRSVNGLNQVGIASAQERPDDVLHIGVDSCHDDIDRLFNAYSRFFHANFPDRLLPIHVRHPEIHAYQVKALVIFACEADRVHSFFPIEGDITLNVIFSNDLSSLVRRRARRAAIIESALA